MKRLVAAALIALTLVLSAPVARAADERDPQEIGEMDHYEDAFSHPLRLAYYLLYPIGFTAEWLIMRPFHYSGGRMTEIGNFDDGATAVDINDRGQVLVHHNPGVFADEAFLYSEGQLGRPSIAEALHQQNTIRRGAMTLLK